MREPSLYPGGPPVEVRETHISVVFLAGDRAYKVKKPVTLPFLDYGTLEQRRYFCREEVRLNADWAPGTYLGVRALVPSGDGYALAPEEAPDAVEYAVEMRRLPEDRTLERLIRAGAADERLVERLAQLVASLHARAEQALPGHGGPDHVAARLDENFDTVRPHADGVVDRGTFAAIERFARAFLDRHRQEMEDRVAAGRAREGHGDLRAEHVMVIGDRLLIFDRIEFDRSLRDLDVAADLAFLVMDLERLGARSLATVLERSYVAETGDTGLHGLLPFYACYRAWVRGKVACLRLGQLPPGDPRRESLAASARELFALSLRFAWRTRLPLVVVVCGIAASGKSSLATALAERSGLARLSSDAIRKSLAGAPLERRLGEDAYRPDMTRRVYEEIARRARESVARNGGVIVDATFLAGEQRAVLLEQLRPTGARVLFFECRAPLEVLRRRSEARTVAPERGSDATWEVVRSQAAAFEPLDDIPAGDRFALGTDRTPEETLGDLERLLSGAVD
jgi:hypothetical protein